jgi:hypothetical protein
MGERHHVVIGSWEQGRGKGEPYVRMYEVRCDPCRWRTEPLTELWSARRISAEHQGIDELPAAPWVRGPGGT